ncbi:MAG: hypothetical protein A3C35_01030 [Omnitrophica bacterium RIFCSPHIGHO2_02_FULL_46_11]|nr:MAG: hypothetical protein A3C35_01030 [Omnitrophica bacterium RIFCSPHIGHO2_02_FULL_46_11]
MKNLWAITMVGGHGTRLWPLSRRKTPKPFLKLIPGKPSLLEATIKRLRTTVPANRILIIGSEHHLKSLRQAAKSIPRANIIGEPASRNTAATVAFGASLISKRDPDALVLVAPADHWIANHKGFRKTVGAATRIAKLTSSFAIFGATPTYPASSYGYLRAGRKTAGSVYELKQFVEKPNQRRAEEFLRTGKFFWHAGIFLAPVKTILDSIRRYAPLIYRNLSRLNAVDGKIVPPKWFRSMPSISIDYAVLEKLNNAYLVRCDFDWCDVGTWKSFDGLWPKDQLQNSVWGTCLPINSRRNVIYSQDKMICLQGVDDLVVIDTPDALLVSRKDSAEEMRELVRALPKKKIKRLS